MKKIYLNETVVSEESKIAVMEVLDSGWLVTGPYAEKAEKCFKKMFNVSYALMVTSATAALHLSCILANKRWAEKEESWLSHVVPAPVILTTPNTFVATNLAIDQSGACPIWCDIDLGTGNISPQSIADTLKKQTPEGLSAIMVVHYGGMPCDLKKIRSLAREYKIPVIEDAAHGIGARYEDKWIGETGQYVNISFNAKKNLGCGDGGMLILRNKAEYEWAKVARWFGIDKTTYERSHTGSTYKWSYDIKELGYKYNPTDIVAAIAATDMPKINDSNTIRRFNQDRYRYLLSGVAGVTLLDKPKDRESSAHLMVIRVERRDDLAKKLGEAGVEVGVHYKPNNAYAAFGGSLEDCEETTPNAYEWFRTAMTLPLHTNLSMDDIYFICKIIRGGW